MSKEGLIAFFLTTLSIIWMFVSVIIFTNILGTIVFSLIFILLLSYPLYYTCFKKGWGLPKVLNKRVDKISSDAVYIGRPSIAGNPFVIGRDGSRLEVIQKYREYLKEHPEIIDWIKSNCKGKDVVCWCSPSPCHGDVVLEVANG